MTDGQLTEYQKGFMAGWDEAVRIFPVLQSTTQSKPFSAKENLREKAAQLLRELGYVDFANDCLAASQPSPAATVDPKAPSLNREGREHPSCDNPRDPFASPDRREKLAHTIAKQIACEEDCQKWPNGCGCALNAADAILTSQPSPAATVDPNAETPEQWAERWRAAKAHARLSAVTAPDDLLERLDDQGLFSKVERIQMIKDAAAEIRRLRAEPQASSAASELVQQLREKATWRQDVHSDLHRAAADEIERLHVVPQASSAVSAGELLPCPFCGVAPCERFEKNPNGPKYPDHWFVWCENLDCKAGGEAMEETQEEARRAWNTRTPTEPQTAPTRDQIAEIIKDKVDYFLHDEQGPLDAADAILALSRPQSGGES